MPAVDGFDTYVEASSFRTCCQEYESVRIRVSQEIWKCATSHSPSRGLGSGTGAAVAVSERTTMETAVERMQSILVMWWAMQ